jgi:hypothetical protein
MYNPVAAFRVPARVKVPVASVEAPICKGTPMAFPLVVNVPAATILNLAAPDHLTPEPMLTFPETLRLFVNVNVLV